MPRLLHTGQVIIDLAMSLDTLPASGGDALAHSASFHAGGGFNVMAAAQRNGLQSVYLGRHGQGQFGDMARQAMHAEGIHMTLPVDPHKDTGLCVALTEASAERTFISCIGAEGGLSAHDLAHVSVQPDDRVYVSGYSLLHVGKARPLLQWIQGLAQSVQVTFDPGPLLTDIDPQLLDAWLAFWGAVKTAEAINQAHDHSYGEYRGILRKVLMELARGREYDVFDRSIDVQISRLRKLIEEDPSKPRYLQTVWGFGYVFVPDGNKHSQ